MTNIKSPVSNPVNGMTIRKDNADKTIDQRKAALFTVAFRFKFGINTSAIANPIKGMIQMYLIPSHNTSARRPTIIDNTSSADKVDEKQSQAGQA